MEIRISECLGGAEQAIGLAVIIDVFRAFSVACNAFSNGASEYYVTSEESVAREFAAENGALLMGEKNSALVPGFDFGNSPSHIRNEDFTDRALVHTTSAGTRGLLACTEASDVITGAFVNAGAICRYIREKNPEIVTLVALGTQAEERSLEDTMCAMYIKNELENYPNSFETLKKAVRAIPSAQKFFTEETDFAPEEDFELCMSVDEFDFVLEARAHLDGVMRLERIDVPV